MDISLALTRNQVVATSIEAKVISFFRDLLGPLSFINWYTQLLEKYYVRLRGLKSMIEEAPSEELKAGDYKTIVFFRDTFLSLQKLYDTIDSTKVYPIKIQFARIIQVLNSIIAIYEADFFDWDPDAELQKELPQKQTFEIEW